MEKHNDLPLKDDDLLNFAMENMMIYLWKKWSSAKLFHGKHDDLPMKDEYLLNVAMGKTMYPWNKWRSTKFCHGKT